MKDIKAFCEQLREILPAFSIREEEPLAKHTSFRIGGNARVMVFPRTAQELSQVLKAAKCFGLVPRILGAGTNVLAPDEGIDSLVICLKETFMGLRLLDGNVVEAMAGMSLAQTAMFAARNSLSGMECLHGIPGTVGGGVYMNAGAYGGEIKDVAVRTEFMDFDGECRWYEGEMQGFGYRKSVFQALRGVIVRTQFQLNRGVESEIREKMRELNERRRSSQPLDKPSAGSTFKRPEGYFAGTLIDQTGLKGLRVGGAQISEKHAGFVVNTGGATAKDVLSLIALVQERVFQNSGVRLEPEVRLWQDEMQLTLTSFGRKYGMVEADIVLDVRCLDNPYWVRELREKSGLEAEVRDFIFERGSEYLTKLSELIRLQVRLAKARECTSLHIAVGCTGGRHRSVVVAEFLAKELKDHGVTVIHRDIGRG